MKKILLFLVLITSKISQADDASGTLILICNVEIFSLESRYPNGTADYRKIGEDIDSLIINFDDGEVEILGKKYENYEINRSKHGKITGGPLVKFARPDGTGLVELMVNTLTVDSYTGLLTFTPDYGEYDSSEGRYMSSIGDLTIRGSCNKPGPKNF